MSPASSLVNNVNSDGPRLLVPDRTLPIQRIEATQVTADSGSAPFLRFDSVATLLKNLAPTGFDAKNRSGLVFPIADIG